MAQSQQVSPAFSSLKELLSFLTISRAIFHFVPVRKRKDAEIEPTLMPEETPLDNESRHLIQERTKGTLSSPNSFDVEFNPHKVTPVKSLIEDFFNSSADRFIEISQQLARYLFTVQTGANSPGLLCFLDCKLKSESAAAIVKLESETGSRLFEDRGDGHRRYKMQVLKDLFLTEGTRVFKSALFLPTDAGIRVLACDKQRSPSKEYELARFFLEEFLGCKRIESGLVLTKRFYNSAIEFANTVIPDGVQRNDLYDDLSSQLRRHTASFNVKEFIKEFVPREYRDQFLNFARQKQIPDSFPKDTTEIRKELYRKHIRTAHNIQIRVPEDANELVKIEEHRVIINDTVGPIRGHA